MSSPSTRCFSNEPLVLHEVAEACILKSLGYEINTNTVMEAYPHTYLAHLKAMEIELNEAMRREAFEHIMNRCKGLHTYLEDPYLPKNLVGEVKKLIVKYCEYSHLENN